LGEDPLLILQSSVGGEVLVGVAVDRERSP